MDLANEDLSDILKNMVEAGFEEVFCGLESPYPEVLAEMGKNRTVAMLRKNSETAASRFGSNLPDLLSAVTMIARLCLMTL